MLAGSTHADVAVQPRRRRETLVPTTSVTTTVAPSGKAQQGVLHERDEGSDALRADTWRFVVGPIFCLLSVINAMQWITFSSIVDEVRVFFGMSANQVNFLANTYVIAYVVIVFLSCKLYEVTGIKLGLCVAALTNALGAALKLVTLYAYPNAALLYVAQALNSVTEVLVIATPPLIANRWYPPRERAVANTVLSSALNFGCGVGVLVPTFFVGPGRASRGHFGGLFWLHFALSALALLLIVFVFPRRPRYHASFAAQRQQGKEEARLRALRSALTARQHIEHGPVTTDLAAVPSGSSANQRQSEKKKNNNNNNNGDSDHSVYEQQQQQQQRWGREAAREDSDGASVTVARASEATATTVSATHTHVSRAEADMVVEHEPAASLLTVAAAPTSRDKRAVYARPPPESAGGDGVASKRSSGAPHHAAVADEHGEAAGREEDVEDDDEGDDDTINGDGVARVNVFSVLVDCYRECRRNRSLVLLSLAAAAELGLIWAVATVLPQMLSPYRISEAIAGWIGFCNLVLGTVVCPLFMPLVERFGRHYKYILCSIALVLLINLTALTLLLHYGPAVRRDNQTYYVIVTFVCWGGVAGLCQNFMMPLMFEYVVELTFPLAESTAAPLLTWSACLTNFVLALVFGAVLTDHPSEAHALRVFIGATVVTAFGAAALCCTTPLRKRSEYETRRQDERQRLLIAHLHEAEHDDIDGATRAM